MAAPFYEVQFPTDVGQGASVIVRSKTAVVTRGGGGENRNKRWSAPLRLWDAARGIRYTSDLERVRAFHIVMDGRHAGFRFKDFSDYSAVGQPVDTSAGGPTFQLRKGYTAGDVTKWRTITKPVKGTTRLTLNGEEAAVVEDGAEYAPVFGETTFGFNPETAPGFELDTTTGLLTPSGDLVVTAEDELLAWCEFDVPSRFGSDDFEVKAFRKGNIWEYSNLPVKELRR